MHLGITLRLAENIIIIIIIIREIIVVRPPEANANDQSLD